MAISNIDDIGADGINSVLLNGFSSGSGAVDLNMIDASEFPVDGTGLYITVINPDLPQSVVDWYTGWLKVGNSLTGCTRGASSGNGVNTGYVVVYGVNYKWIDNLLNQLTTLESSVSTNAGEIVVAKTAIGTSLAGGYTGNLTGDTNVEQMAATVDDLFNVYDRVITNSTQLDDLIDLTDTIEGEKIFIQTGSYTLSQDWLLYSNTEYVFDDKDGGPVIDGDGTYTIKVVTYDYIITSNSVTLGASGVVTYLSDFNLDLVEADPTAHVATYLGTTYIPISASFASKTVTLPINFGTGITSPDRVAITKNGCNHLTLSGTLNIINFGDRFTIAFATDVEAKDFVLVSRSVGIDYSYAAGKDFGRIDYIGDGVTEADGVSNGVLFDVPVQGGTLKIRCSSAYVDHTTLAMIISMNYARWAEYDIRVDNTTFTGVGVDGYVVDGTNSLYCTVKGTIKGLDGTAATKDMTDVNVIMLVT